MRSSAGQILETALALRLSPGERFRLFAQPLPRGLTRVLEVASGAPQALHDAAAELGESEPVVLEAARFYLEQMLFAAPDADAYRILGVAPDAAHDEIRLHHRLLQRWLHPDRALAGAASVFATRVNQAWSQLRTTASRREYDLFLASAAVGGSGIRAAPPTDFRSWNYEEAEPRHGRRSRWLLGAALTCSVLLAVLIARHGDDADQAAWDEPVAADSEPAATPAPKVESDLGVLSNALGHRDAAPSREPAVARAAGPTISSPPTRREPIRPAPIEVSPPLAAQPPSGVARAARGNLAVMAMPHPVQRDARAVPSPRLQSAQHDRQASRPAPVAEASVLSPSQPAVTPPTAMSATPVSVPPAPSPAPTVAIRPPSDGDPAVLIERMHKAEQRVAQVAAYLSAAPGAAPLWNDVRTQASAERLRRRLAMREGASLQLLAPNWQLRPGDASYSSPYRCDQCEIGRGQLEVQLVWREGLWLVRDLDLGPPA